MMRQVLLLACALFVLPATASNQTVCDKVEKFLSCPHNTCIDLEGGKGAQVTCSKEVLNHILGLQGVFAPCDPIPHVNLSLTYEHHHANHTIKVEEITYGKDVNIPIPGLSIGIAHLGAVGLDLAVLMKGNLADTSFEVGVDACARVLTKVECGSKLTHKLPVWIFKGKDVDFSDVCARPE